MALAERWQTTTKTLSNRRDRGQGPALVRIGTSIRYARADAARNRCAPEPVGVFAYAKAPLDLQRDTALRQAIKNAPPLSREERSS